MQKKRLLLVVFTITSIFSFFAFAANSSDIIFDKYPIEEALWIGPGFYYGIWFGDAIEYKNWCRSQKHKKQKLKNIKSFSQAQKLKK